MKKKVIGLLISIFMVLVLLLPVHGATKTKGLVVSGDFTWVTAQLVGTYSSGSFTSGDINYVYIYAGLSSKKKGITEVKPKRVSGFVQGTLSGVTKRASGSVTL
ncbi:MAG: hypothetical protein IKS48_02910 [Eubacterium sp.]|nr:hypothetical protein [Eubacterium sp.]